jgi:anthranilate phosphoribosyltransferase
MKGETVDEITAFASVMRNSCRRVAPKVSGRIVDTCGTGGDRLKTFNVSTTAAFVVAGVGVVVAKHGNRAVTGRSGSADVMERLGLNLDVGPEDVERAIEAVGVGFMFAPVFHPAMRHAAAPRREIGIRTVFNILGPLVNPAGANAQTVGVCDAALVGKLAEALRRLGAEEAMVFHGLDGLDEISTIGRTLVAWLRGGDIRVLELTPMDLGFRQAAPEDLAGAGAEEDAELAFRILYGCLGKEDPRREIVAVNAAAGILVGGEADDLRSGVELAQETIESGAAYGKLKALIKLQGDVSRLEELEEKYG